MDKDITLTPMMKQFLDLKAKHPDAVMLFRCGDFYETYSTDAVVASEILGITLTKRNNGKGGQTIEMAGFPHHALDTYLPKLIRAGRRVAICDQLEDPKLAKKLVKRGITELVTPGVAINDNVLNYKENNFLAAVHFGKGACGVAFLDISTGEFLTAEGSADYVEKLLINFAPKEVLYQKGKKAQFEGCFGNKFFTYELDDWVFTEAAAREKLLQHFEVKNLKGFGVEHLKNGVIASGAILQYLILTQHTQTAHITSLARIEEDKYVRLDKFTIRNLELIGSMNEGGSSAERHRQNHLPHGRPPPAPMDGVPAERRKARQRPPRRGGVFLPPARFQGLDRRTVASGRGLGAHSLQSGCRTCQSA